MLIIASGQCPHINTASAEMAYGFGHGVGRCCGGYNIVNDDETLTCCQRGAGLRAENTLYILLSLLSIKSSLVAATESALAAILQ